MVAQHALSLLLELTSHVGKHSEGVHAGKWSKATDFCYWDYPVIELAGKTAGIIGFGRIGQRMAALLQALGMNILTVSGHSGKSSDIKYEAVSLAELYRRSDVISLHCPLTEDNKKMINAESISLMKDGAFLINTARGALIDEEALAAALKSGKLAGAGLDVLSKEQPPFDNPLFGLDNCLITPHIAWSAQTCRARIIEITLENIKAYLHNEPINVVSK